LFKITKRAGWQWHRTRMRDPDRAARLWLAVAVATLWLLSVGEVADETIPVSTLLDVTGMCPERPRPRRATRLRLVRVLRQGGGDTLGGLAASRIHAAGPFCPGTLARRAAVGGGGSRACQGHAEGCMRDWGSADEVGRKSL
jgi:hypothetical protein